MAFRSKVLREGNLLVFLPYFNAEVHKWVRDRYRYLPWHSVWRLSCIRRCCSYLQDNRSEILGDQPMRVVARKATHTASPVAAAIVVQSVRFPEDHLASPRKQLGAETREMPDVVWS